MDKETNDPNSNTDELDTLETLETPSTSVVQTNDEQDNKQQKSRIPKEPIRPDTPQDNRSGRFGFIKKLVGKVPVFNLYSAILLVLIFTAVGVAIYAFQKSSKQNKGVNVATEPLNQEVLDQLKNTDVKIGDPKQILSVEANAVFAGTVLVRGGLEVAGQIKVGGPLNLPGITVSGNSQFNEVSINNLQISGNTTIQKQLTVQGGLTVNGSATFGGTLSANQLSIQNLSVNGDLQFSRHLNPSGGIPGRSNGGALGSGGTSSISGTDTAGTVNINTGGGPAAGCFVTIVFNHSFNATPHVVVTPVGYWGASLDYYIKRSSTSFSICTRNNPPAGKNFAFDYIVID